MTALITALFALLKAMPQIAEGLALLINAYSKHEKAKVSAEVDAAFERLKAAKTLDEKDKALVELDANWDRDTRR